jgi:hypothetical protein
MAKKLKIPKRVAGVKVPRGIRKSTVLHALLANSAGRQILGEALVAGATAAATILATSNKDEIGEAAGGLRKGASKAGNIAMEAVSSATGAMADVIGDAARAALPGSKKNATKHKGERAVTH